MKTKKLFLILFCFLFATGCSKSTVYMSPKIESTSYSEKTVKVDSPLQLELHCDYANIEMYSWDRQEVKFEMKKRVRGTQEKSKLDEKLKDFNINVKSDSSIISFRSEYKGSIRSSDDKMLDLKIYVPRKVKSIKEKIDKGYIKFMDDIKCSLEIEAKTAHVNINRINGSIKLNVAMGNVNINSGIIIGDSDIKVDTGNIFSKSEYDKNIKCKYETNSGNIELYLSNDLQLGVQCYGTIETNEFTDLKSEQDIIVKSGIGKITLKKT